MNWKSLPTWAKGTIAIVSLLAVGGIGYAIYKGIKKGVERGRESKESREAKDELQNLQQQGVNPTFSEAEAQSKVSALVAAADKCDPYGQGATQIITIIKTLKNKADYYLLNSSFGSKTWDECGWLTGDVTGSLTTLLTEELDSGQMAEVRGYLQTIGVTI